MKRMITVGSGAVLIVALTLTAGAAWSRWDRAAPGEAHSQTFACPMHPQLRLDRPGDCPSCGMRLEPEKPSALGSSTTAGGASARPRPGFLHVSPERQQAVGVRLGLADRVTGRRTFRTTGRVAPDENATYPVVAGTSGWIRSVGHATTGALVKKHERLASFYSPEFVAVMQSYYSGLETFERATDRQFVDFNQQRVVEGVRRFADTLRNMGVSEVQLEELRKHRDQVQDIYLISPVDGLVLQRNVATGLRFDRGFEFYRIADLRTVWILADVFQRERPFIRSGMTAVVTTAQHGQEFRATVSDTEPIFDEATLALTVRLETANPDFTLKPGMFVDVEFAVDLPPAIVVPADAIVDTGLRKTVFVDLGDGYLEPRRVETGWRIDDQVEITRGLMPGERIVISGTFLIDSESRMRLAADARSATTADPVCGMDVNASDAAGSSSHSGTTYFFCSARCKEAFDANPAGFVTNHAK